MKAKIEKQVADRKGSENRLDNKINKILERYGVIRAAYHGGDLNGVSGLTLMKNAKKIMTELAASMKSSKRAEFTMLDEDIDLLCTDSEEVLSLFDDFLRILRKGTENNRVEAEQARDKAMEKWWGLDLSVMVKLHLLERHAISHMCKFPGGLGPLVEDWVERYHQIVFRLEEQNKRTSTLEGKSRAFSERQELINNVNVINWSL